MVQKQGLSASGLPDLCFLSQKGIFKLGADLASQ
jgi:hypothetical protein